MSFYLSSEEPFTFRKIAAKQKRPFLLVCDHGSKRIPKALGDLGLPEPELSRHIGWDIGAARVTELVAEKLGAAAILANYSRLVLDLNRDPSDPAAMPEVSDGTVVPANQRLSDEEKAARRAVLFNPYHQAISDELESLERLFPKVALVSIHSFTPRLRENGKPRPWHLGILWRHDQASAYGLRDFLQERTDWSLGDNEPYSMHIHSCYTVSHHAERKGRPSLMLEIRQNEIDSEEGQRVFAEKLADFLQNYRPELFGEATSPAPQNEKEAQQRRA